MRLVWNALGQLAGIVVSNATLPAGAVRDSVEFGYDALGRRVRKTLVYGGRTTYYVWDGDQVAAELDAQGNVTAAYAYYPGVDRPHSARVAPFAGGDRTYYYVQGDAPGTVLGLVDANANVAATYQVDVWGQPTAISEPGLGGWAQPYLFAGRTYDRETGLYYNRARYYDPVARRFLSEDPSGLAGGVNLYAYAGNDPVNYQDPGGTCPTNVNADDDIGTCGDVSGGGSLGKVPVLPMIYSVGWPFSTPKGVGATSNFLNPNARGGGLTGGPGSTGGLGGPGGGGTGQPAAPPTVQERAKELTKKVLACTLDHYGLTAAGLSLAAAGANVFGAGGKFAGATPGTSFASMAARSVFGDATFPRGVRLPTLTGFPGVGQGVRVMAVAKVGTFVGRTVPVVGYALLAYDAFQIGQCAAGGD